MAEPSPLTVSLGDDVSLRAFFCHSQDALSWDAALQHVWPAVFADSGFGRAAFYAASRRCLAGAFSPPRVLLYRRAVASHIASALAALEACGDVAAWIDRLVLRILVSVVFGDGEQRLAELTRLSGDIAASIARSRKLKSLARDKARFDSLVSSILNERLADLEKAPRDDSYVQYLVASSQKLPEPATAPSAVPSPADINVSPILSKSSPENDQRTLVDKDIPTHLLVTILQSRLLLANLSTWHLLNPSTPIPTLQRSKSPLFLLKKAMRHTLLSKTLVPKGTLLARSKSPLFLLKKAMRHTLLSKTLVPKGTLLAVSPAYEHSERTNIFLPASRHKRTSSVPSTASIASPNSTPMGSRDHLLNPNSSRQVGDNPVNQLVLRRYPMEYLFLEIVQILGDTVNRKFDVATNGDGIRYADSKGLFLAWPENQVFIKQKADAEV
ncbi:hypothetical protein NEOLI_005037 [Neolecta irregularis DAH-3]|uniref:Uncharacterized protein n=1 Tax=Neolecta irregularis (strain DAH-3) TaxID=1198029 RepID=A0A1U7LIT3_NEOID|nr:hypothetical protein NEOLI_005037 [Neolecta irregularis DAH-3]|eukprot:OLL22538.1 hypothetical protein NEOLI_005037 [Neolecta irregularis DAH-3]